MVTAPPILLQNTIYRYLSLYIIIMYDSNKDKDKNTLYIANIQLYKVEH